MEHQVGVLILIFVIFSLVVGAAARYFLRKTPIPYSVALLVIGLIVGMLERKHAFVGTIDVFGASLKMVSGLDPHLILFIFIPALIFESAYQMEAHLFKRTLSQTAMLAVPGLVISTLLTASFAKYLFPWAWSWPACLMFGALISATDPVAVVALLKEMTSRKRLVTLIEGESLLNDGTAIVFFTLFYGMLVFGVSGSTASILGTTAGKFAWVVALGVLIGLALGMVALFWIARVFNDPLFEITLSIAVAYLAYIIAEGVFHVSGIVAVVAVALLFAGRGQTMISPEVKAFLHRFWDLLGYLINTLIFLWAGLVIAHRVELTDPSIWKMLFLLYIGLQIIRAIAVGSLAPLMNKMGIGFSKRKTVTVTWGGLRGAIALALALAVGQDENIASDLGAQILFLTAGIVVLTILINGTTMRFLLRYVGYDRLPPEKQAVVDKAKRQIVHEIQSLLPKLEGSRFLRWVDWADVKKDIPLVEKAAAPPAPEEIKKEDLELAFRRRLLEAERKDYWNQFDRGLLSSETARVLVDSVEHALDVYPHLHPRPSLQRLFRSRPIMMRFRRIPFVGRSAKRLAFNKLSTNYEAARGFVRAQIQMMNYVPKLAPDKEAENLLRNEIISNKRETLLGIELLTEKHPEMISGIETRVAKRILLNQERIAIKALVEAGVLDEAEAEKMTEDVERRMQELGRAYFPPKVITPTPEHTLRQVKWLTELPEDIIKKMAGGVEERTYKAHDVIVEQGATVRSLMVIMKGIVQVVKETKEGEEVLDILGPGNVIGETELLAEKEHLTTTRAETQVKVFLLSAETVKSLCDRYLDLREALSKIKSQTST